MPDIKDKADYEKYTKDVARFIESAGIDFLSTGCSALDHTATGHENREHSEPWFSWRPCDCCKSTLGGMREYLFGCLKGTSEQVHFEICEDCVYYIEYGKLDDATMLRVNS